MIIVNEINVHNRRYQNTDEQVEQHQMGSKINTIPDENVFYVYLNKDLEEEFCR